MEIVDPLAVTDAAYISSNLTEDDYTEWAPGQTLVRGDYRMVSSVHSVYQCLVDHTSSSTARAAFTTAVNNSGGYAAGALSIVIDDAGAVGTGINPGDTITLGGAVTAVVQAVDRNTETLTLTSGLSAAVVDNAAVARALVPSNSPLAEAAAVADPLVADPDPAHWVYISQTNKWRLFDGRPSQKTTNALEIDAGIVLAGRICAVGIIGLEDCSAATIELVHNGDTAELAWTKPSDGGSAITGYQYRYRTGGSAGTWSDWTDMTGATVATTQWTVEGLNPDLSYEFQVRAVNADGNGADSNTAALAVTSRPVGYVPPSLPGQPQGLSATATSSTAVALAWTALGDSSVTRWEYRQSTDGGSTWGSWQAISGSDAATTSHNVTGLTPGLAHAFQVRATNAEGAGVASATASVAAPPQPAGLGATAGIGQVALAWTAVGDSTVGGFQYRQSTDGGSVWGAWQDIAGSDDSTTSHTVTGLTPGQAYAFQIRTKGLGGTSTASAQASATPTAGKLSGSGTQSDPYVMAFASGSAVEVEPIVNESPPSGNHTWFRFPISAAGAWSMGVATTPSNADLDTLLYAVPASGTLPGDGAQKDTERQARTPQTLNVTALSTSVALILEIEDWDSTNMTSVLLTATGP